MKVYSPGSLIANRFEVTGQPLKGGMGIVYFCFDHETHRPLALKTLDPQLLSDKGVRTRFLYEGDTWIRLGRHPNIVRAYNVWRIGNREEIFIGLELIAKDEGKANASLRSWLIPNKPLSLKQALAFALQIVRGMNYATTIIPGLLHRDLKPENVLVGRDRLVGTNINRVRVTDFGLVTLGKKRQTQTYSGFENSDVPESSKQVQLTQGIIGTPLYMAPEQWKSEELTAQTDIYSFGCILFEMLAGYPVAEGANVILLRQAHCEGKLRPLPTEMPIIVATILDHCLTLTPRNRFKDWKELEKSLVAVSTELIGDIISEPVHSEELDRGERIANSWSYNDLGIGYLDLGNAKYALSFFENARKTGSIENEQRLEWSALINLSIAYRQLGHIKQATKCIRQALAISQSIDDRAYELNTLDQLAATNISCGDVKLAIEILEQTLATARRFHVQFNRWSVLCNLGIAYKNLGDNQRAIDYHKQATVLAIEFGNRRYQADSLGNLGLTYRRTGDVSQAIECFTQALVISRNIADRYREGQTLTNLGLLYRDQGDILTAKVFFQQSLVIADDVGAKPLAGKALGNLALIYYDLGDSQQAIRYCQQSLEIKREVGDLAGEANTLNTLGLVYMASGDTFRSQIVYEQALTIYRNIGDRRGEQTVLRNLLTT